MRDDWTETTLNELVVQIKEPVKVVPNLSYRLLGVRWYGNGPFIRETVTNKTSKATRLFPVQVGDFIYNRLFAWKGSFGLITNEFEGCFVSSEFPLFRVRSELLDGAILNLIMCQPSKWAQIEIESTGSTSVSRNRWKEDRFLEQVLRLPPIAEQRRIVDVVSSVDTYIDALQQHVDAARTARNAVLHELLTAGGDDWTETTLGDIAQLISRGRAPSYCEDDGMVVLNQKCIRNGRIHFEFARRTDTTKKAIPEWAYLKVGDSLINSTGVGTLGRASFVSQINSPTTFDSHVTLVRPRPESCFASFIGLSLNFRENEIEMFAGGSTGQTELSREAVNSFPVTLPPIAEQKRIVEIVSSMDDVIQAAERAVVEAKNLRSGLLSDLLSGEHEIPVSYDELLGAA